MLNNITYNSNTDPLSQFTVNWDGYDNPFNEALINEPHRALLKAAGHALVTTMAHNGLKTAKWLGMGLLNAADELVASGQ